MDQSLDSDHARISLVLPFLASRRATDCTQYNFIQRSIQKLKPPWKMRRSNILRVAADPQAMENLRIEYLGNSDKMDASRNMISQLAHGDRVTAEQAASQWLAAVEKLSAVRWQSVSNMQMTNSNNQMKDKS